MTATDDRLRPGEPVAEPTAPPAPAATGAGGTFEADWRFLLGPTGLGRVAVVGPCDPALLAALRSVASAVHTDDDPEHPSGAAGAGPFDTVVIDRGRRDHLARAASLVGPAGALWIRRARRGGRARTTRHLRAAGFEDVSLHWHRPAIGRTTVLVHLDDRTTAATVLRSVRAGRKGAAEAALAASGLVAFLGGNVSLLACRPGADAEAVAAPRPGRRPAGLLTPRFAASEAVIGLAVDANRRVLDQIAKVPRLPDGSGRIAHEAAALDAFADRGGPPGLPSHRLVRRGDRQVLVEAAAAGRPLDPRRVRSAPDQALRAGLTWLTEVPRGPASAPRDDGRHRALLDTAATTLAATETGMVAGTRAPWRADAARRTLAALDPLSTAAVPVVFEHGDLSHPNLFLRPDGRLVAIDWERANPSGLPLHDAFFFCGYLAASATRSASPDALVESYLATTGSQGWARPHLELHAERMEVDRRLLHLLELAAWFRAAATLAEVEPTTTPAEPRRHELIWLALLNAHGGNIR